MDDETVSIRANNLYLIDFRYMFEFLGSRQAWDCGQNIFCRRKKLTLKNGNFGQISIFLNKKWKFWSNIEIFFKNRNFGRKSKFSSNIEIFFKNRKLVFKHQILRRKSRIR